MTSTTNRNAPFIAKVYLEPADRLPCLAGAAITGARFCKVTTGGVGNHPKVIHGTAGSNPVGVSFYAAASGADLTLLTEGVVGVEAGENLASGDLISVGSAGVAVVATAASQSGTTPFAVTFATPVVGVSTQDTTAGSGAQAPILLLGL